MKTILTTAALVLGFTATGAFAADDAMKKDGMKKDEMMPAMTMQECKDHMAMSKNDGMKKDDMMMKKDSMCADMMKKDGMMKKDEPMKK